MRGILGIVAAAAAVAVVLWASGPAVGQALPPEAWNVAPQMAGAQAKWAAAQPVRIAVVGDSIAFRPAWHQALRDHLAASHGGGGYGWRGINPDFKYVNAAGVAELKIAYTGLAGNIVKGKGVTKRDQTWGLYTPDGIFSRLRGDGSATVTIPAGLSCTLHYLSFPGGGNLAIDRSGVRILEVPTDSGPDGPVGDRSVELPAGTKFKFSSTTMDWVQVNALDVKVAATPPGGGIVIDRLARGQDNPHGYNTGDTPSTAAILGALDEDLLTIETDWIAANPQSQASFIADIKAYIGFVRGVNPDIGIILIAHHQTKVDTTIVGQVMYQIAIDEGCGFIDHSQVYTNAELVSLGYLADDGVHLSPDGGEFFAERDLAVMGE